MERIEKLQSFLAVDPDDCFVMHALALEYIKAGRDAEAAELFTRVLQVDEKYVGTYYHLGKLLERTASHDDAKKVYERGMIIAREKNDSHAFNELRSAYDELLDEY